MLPDDVPAVAAVDKRAFGSGSWSETHFRDELQHNRLARYDVLDAETMLLGYVGCWILPDEVHLVTIGVDPAVQRQGYGEYLLLHAIGLARAARLQAITLEVRESNSAARGLYEKYGFRQDGRRRNYYSDTREDALILRLPLRGADVDASLVRRQAALERRVGGTIQATAGEPATGA